LLQHSESNRKRFGEANGIDTLLVCISAYKRSAPVGGDEEEYAENLFDSLCSSLLFPANRAFFEKAQGIELMLMCIKYPLPLPLPLLPISFLTSFFFLFFEEQKSLVANPP